MWLKVFDDLWTTTFANRVLSTAMHERAEHREFTHISMDATATTMLRLLGRATTMRHLRPKPTSRCPKERPNEKCSPRLVPVVPAWVLHFFTMRAGPLGTVAKSCSRNVQRSLRTMAILAIYSEQATFRKKTCGSRWLRVLLNGFRKRSDAYSADHWGTSPQ